MLRDFYDKIAIAVAGGFIGAILATLISHLRNTITLVNEYNDEMGQVVEVSLSPRIMNWVDMVKINCKSSIETVDFLLKEIEPFVNHFRKNPKTFR